MNLVKIYILVDNTENTIRYVGKTEGELKSRYKKHVEDALAVHQTTSKFKDNSHRARWLRKINCSFRIQALCEVEFDEWQFWECFFIEYFKRLGCSLTNGTTGGEYGGATGPRSAAFRIKRARIQTGRRLREESVRKIVEKNTGKKRTDETRTKLGFNFLGKSKTEQSRQLNRSKSLQNRPHFTTEQKSKMAFGKELDRRKRPVYQYSISPFELVKVWPSSYQPRIKFGDRISDCLSGRQKSAYTFIWSREELNELPEAFKVKQQYHNQTIYQFDLQGNFIREWKYLDAQKEIGYGISRVLKSPTETAGLSFWRTTKNFELTF